MANEILGNIDITSIILSYTGFSYIPIVGILCGLRDIREILDNQNTSNDIFYVFRCREKFYMNLCKCLTQIIISKNKIKDIYPEEMIDKKGIEKYITRNIMRIEFKIYHNFMNYWTYVNKYINALLSYDKLNNFIFYTDKDFLFLNDAYIRKDKKDLKDYAKSFYVKLYCCTQTDHYKKLNNVTNDMKNGNFLCVIKDKVNREKISSRIIDLPDCKEQLPSEIGVWNMYDIFDNQFGIDYMYFTVDYFNNTNENNVILSISKAIDKIHISFYNGVIQDLESNKKTTIRVNKQTILIKTITNTVRSEINYSKFYLIYENCENIDDLNKINDLDNNQILEHLQDLFSEKDICEIQLNTTTHSE